ncbi:MAG TPA: hypothetical protein G4O16_10150 [Dehalococcoidia bacterium]|nr:hypothetical protein [Dehalococcoidia bacterium]
MEYPWYEIVTDRTLQQGDILEDFIINVAIPKSTEIEPQIYNVIVMSQSCDIAEAKYIILCPIWTRQEIEKDDPDFFKAGKVGHLKNYRIVGWHPINKCELAGFEHPWRVVQFWRILEVIKDEVEAHINSVGKHLRLLSPYRENLSQDFARFFMRVGLPKPLELS